MYTMQELWIRVADRRTGRTGRAVLCLTAVKQALVWPGFEVRVPVLRIGSHRLRRPFSSSSRLVSFILSSTTRQNTGRQQTVGTTADGPAMVWVLEASEEATGVVAVDRQSKCLSGCLVVWQSVSQPACARKGLGEVSRAGDA